MMSRILPISLLSTVIAMSSCAQNQQATKVTNTKIQPQDYVQVNLKSFKKNGKGAYIIFDGTSLDGWRGYNKNYVPNKWRIEDGMLMFSPKTNAEKPEGGDLVFSYQFKNFELEFEWKVAKGGNSGVFYLAQEIKNQPIYVSAPEYQLLDNDNHPDAKLGVDGNRKSASLYDMIPAKPQNGKPAGQWNKAKIVVIGNTVQHFQNDEKVVEFTIRNKAWTELLQSSKFSEAKWPLAFELLNNVGGKTKSGLIGFQDHGDDVWFKNITVKIL